MGDLEIAGPLDEVDLHDAELLECPYPFFKRLHDEAPVLEDKRTGVFQVSSYELVTKVLFDAETFSNETKAFHGKDRDSEEIQAVMADGYPRPPILHQADGETHSRSRKLINNSFSAKRITELAPVITALVDELIDDFAGCGKVEFVEDFAQLLPLRLIVKLLGVPHSDLPLMRRWTNAFTSQFSGNAGADAEITAAHVVVEFQKYFAAMLRAKFDRPSDDLLSILGAAVYGETGHLTLPEALQVMQQLVVAGHETTASSLSEGMRFLAEDATVASKLAANRSRIGNFVDEVLRFHSAAQSLWRVATRDTELGGVFIPKGASVLVRYSAANRDEATFANAGAFDCDRGNARRHVGFGYGIHTCVGNHLARQEMVIAFDRLLTRIKGWRIAGGADLSHENNLLLRGLKRLDLKFDIPS